MHKRKWTVKTVSGFLALVLAISLLLVAAPASAQDPPELTKTITLHDDGSAITCDNPMSGIVDFQFDYNGGLDYTPPAGLAMTITGPTPYNPFTPITLLLWFPGGVPVWDDDSERAMMEMGIVDWDGDGTIQDDCVLSNYFLGNVDDALPATFTINFSLDTEKNWSKDTDVLAVELGELNIDPDWDRPAHTSVWPMAPCIIDGIGQYNIEWMVVDDAGVDIVAGGQDEPLYNDPYMMPSLGVDVKGSVQCFYAKNTGPDVILGWTVLPGVNSPQIVIEGGGGIHQDWICVSSGIPGDTIVKAYIDVDDDDVADFWISGEKKWGDICKTELEALDPDTGAQKTNNIEVGDTIDIDEMVYATIHWGSMDPEDEICLPAGGALVHWWLVENTDDENQAELLALLEGIFGGTVTDEHPYYQICGNYAGGPPDYVNPYEEIDAFATLNAADHTEFIEVESVPVGGGCGAPVLTYVNSVSDDSMPWEETGWTQTTIEFCEADAVTGVAEEVMVVLLVEYPDINMFHGENPVCVEIVKITPKPEIPPTQVKIPQVRWAGEKIVLEKYWGENFEGNAVIFKIDEGSIGVLEPIEGFTFGGNEVRTTVGKDGVARCILESEYQGQAEVKCFLFATDYFEGEVIGNHDFPVFFLQLEDIMPIFPEPETVEVGELAEFVVLVKGWFTSADASDRPRLCKDFDLTFDANGDGDPTNDYICLPAGRWVLPDDWALLAGADWQTLRPHWDIMDGMGDDVGSANPLGPYYNVNSLDGEAHFPVIGPFSTLQPIMIDPVTGLPVWDATATVPADATVGPPPLRTTVVPNGVLDFWDCPMPPAKIIFNIRAGTGGLVDAVSTPCPAGDFCLPFYAEEIPASQFIPPLGAPEGYSWDSWNWGTGDPIGPYWFFTDLGLTPGEDQALEVYSDNHGLALVLVNGPPEDGEVVLTATADYPYLRKHAAMKSVEVTQGWGEPPTECEDSPDVEVGLASILDGTRRVVVYHEWGGVWTGFDTIAPPAANDLTTLESGKGYWIYASTDCTLDYFANVHMLTSGLWYMIGWLPCP
jgi:hypothetical protein